MIINDVHRGIHKHRKRKRIGRGTGSGTGKTAGRGHKGFGSRSGASTRRGHEGGQMPLFRRLAKVGFNNKAFAPKIVIVNLSALEKAFESGDTVSPQSLADKGLAKGRYDVLKILGNGSLSKKLTVQAHRFSKGAEEKIAASGGTVEIIAAT
jgi:large subunit ribosomal protein L15